MQLFVNNLSIHGQFLDIQTFKEAISRVMAMREIARQFGRQLYCHRNLAYAQVTKNLSMPQAIQHFDKNEQRSVMQWLTRNGPFGKTYANIARMNTWNVMAISLRIWRVC